MTANVAGTSAIGLIGVGLLGSALAERLISQGFRLKGFDIAPAKRNDFAKRGGIAVNRPEEVVQGCQTLLLSLPSSEIVRSLLTALQSELQPGQVILDTTTGDPCEMVSIAEFLNSVGIHYMETSVAGSSAQVQNGEVTLFVGGDFQVFENVKSILGSITKQYYYLGPTGSASRFKLVHNLLLGLHRAVLAEGLHFAETLDFDPGEALRILMNTPAASTVMQTKGEQMVSRNYTPQAKLSQHLKDVRLILTEARRHNIPTPLSQLHETLLEQAEQQGLGDQDNSAVIEVFRSQKVVTE